MDLFERERPLRTLEEALEAARTGEGRLALISGEAGIGKTALVEHFTAQQAGRFPIYWGACDALFTPRPLGPFSDIAFQMRSHLLEMIQTSSNWYQTATAFFRELTERGAPVILVVEDIHWADEATLDMLKFLGRRIQHSRVLLILTFRDDELTNQRLLTRLTGDLPARITVRVVLSPLSQNSVNQMAQRVHRQPEGLFVATGGNPFFVTEMLENEPGVVPASVRDLVLARVARLSTAARDLAELAALVPGGVELWVLEQVFHTPDPAIDECVERGVLRSNPERLAFRHELSRRAVEDSLFPGRARQFHAQILRALLDHGFEAPPLARIVHHGAQAGDFSALLRYAPAAAHQASRLGAHREAAAHYQIVLNQVTSLPPETRAVLLEGRSFECYLTGEINTAFQTRQQAAAIWKNLQRIEKEGDNLRWLSRLAWFSGKRKDAEQYAQAAVEILEKLPPGPELAMAYSNKSQLHMLKEETSPGRDWGERAIKLASRLDVKEILVHALTNVGAAEIMAGEESGWDRITQALGIARQKELHDDVGRAYANLISLAIQRRQYGRAAAWLEDGLAYMEDHDLDSYRIYLLGWRGRLYFETGRWSLAEADAIRALGLHTSASVIPIPALLALGHLKVRRGDADAATWLEKASSLSLPTGELQRIGPLAAARAEAAWWQGEPRQVEAVTRPGYELALQHQDPWILGQLAYWLWRSGRTEIPLERLADPYRRMIQGEWQVAAQAWRRLGCPFELALALSEGDSASQIEALSIFERLGARPAAEMLKNRLHQQGVKGIPRGPRPATRQNLAGLTNRELEVLALVAEGLSNAGIASRLSISKKTVDHHMSALLSKLEADTRSQAMAIARRQGLLP